MYFVRFKCKQRNWKQADKVGDKEEKLFMWTDWSVKLAVQEVLRAAEPILCV